MRLDVPVYDVVVVAVLQRQENLPDVVGAHRLRIDEPGRGPLDDLEAQVGAGHELEDHVEHALAAVRLQQLHDVRVLEHVADGGLALQVVQTQAGRGRELGHVHDLDRELLQGLAVHAAADQRKRALTDDLMELVDVVEEDLVHVGHVADVDDAGVDVNDGEFSCSLS